METFKIVLKVFLYAGNIWMTMLLAYYIYLSIFGFRKESKTYADQEPEARFLILVPAHNEEAVIGDMVKSLQALDYPEALYDYYIIADNCTDSTAEIARALGAKVIENHKPSKDSPTGKPIALRNALNSIEDYAERYDLLMVFDADNLMDGNILREVNSQFISENKPEIIQCYLGSKNHQGIVASFYHVTYTITNRFSNLAKYRLGLNVAVGGTGFAIQTAYLKQRGGWTTMSLTEDFEMQVDVTLNGGRILWNHNVRIYDEKPTNLYASFRQRVRWSQGHWFVALRNTPRLMRVWMQRKVSFGEMLSLLTYMYSMAAPVFAILWILSNAMGLLTPVVYGNTVATAMAAAQAAMDAGATQNTLWGQLLMMASSLLMMGYSTFVLYWWAQKADNGERMRLRDVPFILVSYLTNLVNVSLAQIVGLFKHRQQNKWVKTSHKIRRDQPQAVEVVQ
ncbi:glycosyltransferase [Eubacteriales bacterium OttesenSCG-928-A19]|nr:glycosyltransferase [Eubacteriales bacterium OttesenSCG-928-A19]